CITTRFVFEAQVKGSCAVQCPTRVVIISAFIWKRAMAASKEDDTRPSILSHPVNLRKRMVPPLPEILLEMSASAQCIADNKFELHNLVGEIKEAILKIDDDFVKKLWGHDANSVISKQGSKDRVDYFGFTSWCKLGFYEAKPIWVSSIGMVGSVFMNLIVLVDTSCGNGIEAWVTLQDIAILEGDQELFSLASIDP
ncbi:LOW QUALITY PROTEIN: Transferase domain-containing protein, partial [Cephalotus follicularis]